VDLAGKEAGARLRFLAPGAARRAAAFAFAALAIAALADATTYKQPGFSEIAVFTGLTNPTVIRFLPDGRVLVAEKSGLIKVFPNLTTNSYTVVADLRTEVHNFWDRGLLGLAIDPNFSINNYIYVLYAYDAVIGGTPPRWGVAGATSDGCATPPGATTDGCVISSRLSRLTAVGLDWTASETPLVNDWCQQFPSHSSGALDFGADGYLYVSGGDGASFNNSDWGQYGGTSGTPPPIPANPCGDPPFPVGTPQTKPTAEGGALRSQSPRRTAGEPRLLNGSILRLDPATGAAAPGNPLIGSGDVNEQRIIGYGLRNPFRMIVRPGTNEVWIADVGWSTWEELNKIPDITVARNFGWPCFEGNAAQYTGLNICPTFAQTTPPLLTYNHSASLVPGDGCATGSSSIAGLAFYQGGSNYPSTYPNALFFSDYSRKCMWVMFPDGSGNPNPASTAAFANNAAGPVDLRIGSDGNLYYADFDSGRVMRVKYGLAAVATANPTSGDGPLTVNFDGTGSIPAQAGDTLTFAWDLDGDGQYDDSALSQPTFVYNTSGNYTVLLKVTDQRGGSSISAPITISVGNTPPTAVIDTPASSLTWKVGDTIAFTGHATDAQDGALPATALSWQVIIHHCPSNCHTHVYQTFDDVAGGSFPAPDHEYPSYLEIQLTATDSQGLTNVASVNLNPQTASLNFLSSPAGLQLTVGTSAPQATPFTQTVIVNSVNSVQATSPQGSLPNIWEFSSWSDGGAQNHNITAPAGTSSYTATYATHADLAIGVTPSPEPVGAGATLTYTLNVSNAGPSQAGSVSVTDTLPAGTAFVSAAGTGWTCSGTGPVTCTMPSLGIAAAAPITLTVTAPAEGGAILNSATVSSATNDPATGNNTAATTSNVFARADLSAGQSGAPASICTGQPITYTLTVSNAGPSTATSISLTDTLPAGATFVSASGTGWSCSGTTTVTCTRPSLAPGAAPAVTLSIDAPASAGTAVNGVAVSAATNDPSSANNSATASTPVNAIPTAPAAGNNGPVCTGATLQLTAGTVAGATYAWTGPNGFASTLQNPSIPSATTAASGTYSVTVTVNACTSGASTTSATVRPLPTAVVSGTAQICAGGATAIQAALTGTGPWTVTWSDGVTQSGVASSPATRSVSPGATTTYTVTSVADANCAGTASGSAVVTVNPRPTAAASGTAAICAGGATPLSGSGGVSCAWAPTAGLSNAASCSPSASPGATTTYTLTVTNATGCVSNNAPTVTVTVNAKPTAAVSGTAAICAGGTTQISAALTGAGPWNVTWSDGVTQSGVASSPATRSVSPGATTTYTVTAVSDTHCAGTSSGSAVVTVNPAPTAVATGTATICEGSATPLSGSGGSTCSWAPATGLSDAASCSPSASPAATTTYTLTVTSATGCVSTNAPTVTVTLVPKPTAAVSGSGAICAGGSAPIQAALTGAGPWTVTWSDGVTQSGVAASPAARSVSPGATTTYTVTAVSDTHCAGTSSGAAIVTVHPTPTAVASGTAAICVGAATPLSGSGGASCAWAPATGLSDAASCSPTASPSATTMYTLTVTDATGCVSTNAPIVTVTVNPIPTPPAAGNGGPVCAGDTLLLTASTVPGATYSWTGPNGFASSLQNPSIPNATPAATGVYSVTATVSGCASTAATTAATVHPRPAAAVSGTATVCQGTSTDISAALTGTAPWSVTWSDGLTQSVGSSPATRTVTPLATTTYIVTGVIDAHCSGTGSGAAVVTVGLPVDAPVITAPNWTPIGTTGIAASASAHDGSTYAWTLTGGTLTSGQGSAAITLDAGDPGTTMVLQVAETNTACVSPVSTVRIQVDFLDAPPPYLFHDFVDTIARNGITAGCGTGLYCPDAPNTRAQMAVFLLKSKYGSDHVPPPATGTIFLDVPATNPFAPWIEELYGLQVTGGCGSGNYCPGAAVTRAQMAVFLLKTLYESTYVPPPATGTMFDDVPLGAFAAAWIEDLANRAITGGCQASPPLYCPDQPNTRGQMAVFLTKTFALQ
jgi:uncharacterized repeat protein (TIGR01451 family)